MIYDAILVLLILALVTLVLLVLKRGGFKL